MENSYRHRIFNTVSKSLAVLLISVFAFVSSLIMGEVYAQTVKPSAALPAGVAQARFSEVMRMTNKGNVYQVLKANRFLAAEEKLAIAAVRQLPQNSIEKVLKPGSGGDPRASGKLGGAVDEATDETDSTGGQTSAVEGAMEESKPKTELKKAIEGAREPIDPKPMIEPLARELGINIRSVNIETFRSALARAAAACGPTCNR